MSYHIICTKHLCGIGFPETTRSADADEVFGCSNRTIDKSFIKFYSFAFFLSSKPGESPKKSRGQIPWAGIDARNLPP